MPAPLNFLYQGYADESVIPAGAPSNWCLLNFADKRGERWVTGDRKDQILPYRGRVARGKVESVGHPVPGWNWWWYYQPAPFSADHPYSGNAYIGWPSWKVQTVNRAYARFVDVAVGETASWGTTIAEGREALNLIGDRALRLRRAYKNLKRGNFRQFLRELSAKPKRKHKSVIRTSAGEASALWLEYWFGWAPLAGEIYSSTIALTAAQVAGKHFATASVALPERTIPWYNKRTTESGRFSVKTGAVVRYDSMDIMLAQQMGLLNPLAIAWELVPFSFVVDWFTGVGNVLGARSDFYGTTVTEGYSTLFLRTNSKFVTWSDYDPSSVYSYSWKSFLQDRRLGLIQPVATYPRVANFGESGTRAATAVSLLVQLFLDK